MPNSFEGTTLALQHYYDIGGISRKFPLMTVYQAQEQPFGQRMAVWMAANAEDMSLSKATADRLDEALLKNRAVNEPHVLRVLDYGSSEGHSFVVTDYIDAPSLRTWLGAHGPLAPWQALRLLEQLTNIIVSAHRAGFKNLCLTSENVFVVDEKRFEIVTGPLGIGLFRSEILALRNVSVSNALYRHIPPWEYGRSVRLKVQEKTEGAESHKSDEGKSGADRAASGDENASSLDAKSEVLGDNENIQDVSLSDIQIADGEESEQDVSLSNVKASDVSAEQPEDGNAQAAASDILKDDASSDGEKKNEVVATGLEIPEPPEDVCSDIYGLAAMIYEALCGQHPYFSDDRDLGDAALSLMQAKPANLSDRVEISDGLSDVVMETLVHPKRDTAEAFLSAFAAQCTERDREMASRADKVWFEPVETAAPGRRRRVTVPKVRHPWIIMASVGVLVLIASIFVTYRVAQYSEPVDLFAVPELVPAASDGVDVVIASRTVPPDTSVYMTSLADGSLIKLGGLPMIYRKQAQGAKLSFVIADERGHSEQVQVTVKGENGLMMVYVEPKW